MYRRALISDSFERTELLLVKIVKAMRYRDWTLTFINFFNDPSEIVLRYCISFKNQLTSKIFNVQLNRYNKKLHRAY